MSTSPRRCLITIQRADVRESRIVECVEHVDGPFLIIPIEDYFVKGAGDRRELRLRVPEAWLVVTEKHGCELACREVIDLDTCDADGTAAGTLAGHGGQGV